ncbi:lipopolysaccharide heptosyltransferase I [Chitinimonas lacunae]|uniref:Lipopolysaccharide heptosyltransferase 1 n=1 Tax=Chitinimonas lacunae TaxID=1963018 RepID=A0ABV8MP91_9NEIS
MPKILLLRLSSMGDIVHNMPAATDIAAHFPEAEIHWVVEENFIELPQLHPAIKRIVPIALRRWRRRPFDAGYRAEMRRFRDTLQAERYDLAIDSQGLIKSALVGRLSGATVAGFDRHSARDPFASLFYHRRFDISRELHVIVRNRLIAGRALGYEPEGPLDFGLQPPPLELPWRPASPYAVFLTATSRDAKLWPEADWISLGRVLASRGLRCVLPWGSPPERERAERIAQVVPDAVVAPRFNLTEAAVLLAGAEVAVGVDTGLMHLAGAVATPTVAIFCDSPPQLAGVRSSAYAVSLGGIGTPPRLAEVEAATLAGLESRA